MHLQSSKFLLNKYFKKEKKIPVLRYYEITCDVKNKTLVFPGNLATEFCLHDPKHLE